MSPLEESQTPVTGHPNNLRLAQSDTTHQPPQSVKTEADDSDPPAPDILQFLSNKEFTAWSEYLGKEKHEDYIQWKKSMIGEGHLQTINENAGIENKQRDDKRPEIEEAPVSGLDGTNQEKTLEREQEQDSTFGIKEKHIVSEEKKEN
ncbi:uncharacterized protein Z519_09374 [Cladophialophora bantiana CBS 173.52]|uniref:Uncharacterized protein n=1 Tax=Cladophialophora bantiana (strain ATCC 10958 / CBS 173.52 / CDC B-1940 / NIH 8579) TaxID=1442370 RepID=A0A0D2HZF2_CLAB1|nr:uncharacterized protein Z519_09374 [Cladophialophora bantiana CBS 173.52]KIW89944.1 hypothetical protein Z519_09374 [Cladophialophora bantiana CBS 173.52]